jgi:hypothetical protein
MKNMRSNKLRRDKEFEILLFLWRWKVSTTSAIYIRFRPTFSWTPFTAYQRLLKLSKKGYIEAKLTNTKTFAVWTLTRNGFAAIREGLPVLREEGFASEAPEHDIFVLAAQFGEWLPKGTVNDVAFFTEQELRRQAPDTLFDWIPPLTMHHPDGYWYFPSAKPKSLVALEVELNRKSFEDYKGVGNFYNKYKVIESTLWIVQSANLARKIVESAHGGLAEFRDIHNFVLFTEFAESGWSAKIFQGFALRSTMREFLETHRLNQAETIPKPTINHGLVSLILDPRHRRFKTSVCTTKANSPIP